MKALVVYESMYGNTAAIGEAIASSLRTQGLDVSAGPVTRFDPSVASEVDLLVVGGPTHAHGMSSSQSRKTAADDGKNTFADPTLEPGLRTWIKELAPGAGRLAVAFDTRIDKPVILTGSAAKGIARRLVGQGFRLVVGPECFLVSTKNRLLDGEIAHAAAWGARVADQVAPGNEP
jgi:hypothetical protein